VTDEEIQKLAKALVSEVLGMIAPKPAPSPIAPPLEARWMRIADFAKRVGYSRTTIQNWVKAGMPAVETARGHRIEVRPAEEWIKMGGPRRAAHLDA
jgi:hypothetical protein